MNSLNEYRKTSLEFRRLSSNFLRTTDADNFLYVKRLYAYLNDQKIIQQIINDAISTSEYDCEQFITENKHSMMRGYEVNVPINEADHIKALYNLLEELAAMEDKRLYGIAVGFVSHKGFNETIQNFLDKMFKPLIDFITDSLSKEMMVLEQNMPTSKFNQHIENNYGTANAGELISSTQNSGIDISELSKIIETIKHTSSLLENVEDKETVQEYIEVIETELNNKHPKKSLLKTAMTGLKAIKGSVEFSAAIVAIIQFIQSIL